MENELQALTTPGRELVAIAERFAAEFSPRASELDRSGEFAFAELEALKASPLFYAPAPIESGGLGVESVHDLLVASSRLARANASITLGLNMHLLVIQAWARQRRMALNRGEAAKAEGVSAMMRSYSDERAFIAAAISEADQDLLRPTTTARFDGQTWRVSGRKIISSGAPAASHFSVGLTAIDDDGKSATRTQSFPAHRAG